MSPEHGVPGPARADDPPLEQLIAQFIRAAGLRLAAPETAPAAVSQSEARALSELLAARGIAQGELAGLLGLEKSTVSRLAAGLERKGFVRRGRDTGNQRYVRLYLTEEGRLVAARLWHGWHDRQARILGSLTEEERTGLAVGLRGLVRAIWAESGGVRLTAPSVYGTLPICHGGLLTSRAHIVTHARFPAALSRAFPVVAGLR